MLKRAANKDTNKDASQTAEELVRAVTGSGKVRGESLLGSPALRKKLREAKERERLRSQPIRK